MEIHFSSKFSAHSFFLCLNTQRSNKKLIGTATANTNIGANIREIPIYKKKLNKNM